MEEAFYFDNIEVAFYFDHMEVVRGQFQREILMLPFSQLQNQPRGNVWKVISDRGEIKSHIEECLKSHIRSDWEEIQRY